LEYLATVVMRHTVGDDFRVIVKEIKSKNDSCKEMERAKREVLHVTLVITDISDHPSIPHFSGAPVPLS